MINAARQKLHAFERALFLKSRAMKSGTALAAVVGLTAMLHDLGSESIVQSNPTASAAFAQANAELAKITSALHHGANDAALALYAHLVSSIPEVHAVIAQAIPAEIRGHDPTPPEPLAHAMQRALSILGF